MFRPLKNIFIFLIMIGFSINSFAVVSKSDEDNSIKKSKKNLFIKTKSKKKGKKSKKRKKHFATQQKSKTIARKNNNPKFTKAVFPQKIEAYDHNFDIEVREGEIAFDFIMSKFGQNVTTHSQKVLQGMKEIVFESLIGMDISEYELIPELISCGIDVKTIIADVEILNEVLNNISLKDLNIAEKLVEFINLSHIKNTAYAVIFEGYLYLNDLLSANRIYNLIEYDEDEFEKDDFAYSFVLAYLQKKNFAMAKKMALEIAEEDLKDDALVKIAKYYTRYNDTENAKRIKDSINENWKKYEVELYLLDCFARNNNLQEFQKLAFSSNNIEFQKSAKFILNIYQNKFEEAAKDMPMCDDEIILNNFIEILCSSHKVCEAEMLLDYFGVDWQKEELNMFFVNAYLKEGNIKEAKRLRDEIQDSFEKWQATKLISINLNG